MEHTSAPAVATPRTTHHLVQLAGSTLEFTCAEDDTLLRAAQRAGIGFPYECNVGSCGNCRFDHVEGEVATVWNEAPGLSEKDRQRGRRLGCQSQPRSDCQIKLRPAARWVPAHRPQRLLARLSTRRAITHDISEFSFTLARPQAFEPGQYALATLPGVAGPRAWSMSNNAQDEWQFLVRRVPGGQGSAALFDALQTGQQIELDGPYGMAWLKRDAPRDILCLAGGSGLAPMVSIARAAAHEPRLLDRQLHFVYGGRTPADVCGRDMLEPLPGFGQRLHYHAVLSAASSATDGTAWTGPTGFVHEAALRLFGPQLAAMEVYFAGPPAMAQAVQKMLLEANVPPEQQHFDAFY